MATFHRNGGNFGPEWVATFKRNGGSFAPDYAVSDNIDTFAAIALRIDAFNDDSYERWQAEIEFHQGLVRLTGINALIREFERNFRLNIFYRINRAIGMQDGQVINQHSELLRKLQIEDPDIAEQAIRNAIHQRK